MDSGAFERLRDIVLEVASAPPEMRDHLLDRACGDDDELRAAVLRLLEFDGGEASLERPEILSGAIGELSPSHFPHDAPTYQGEREGHSLPDRIGPYQILGRIAEGGMGAVYEARQENPQRVVALKVIRPAFLGLSARKRFRFEVQVLGQLRHPGIAQIYQAGEAETPLGTQPYFAMERIRGRTLTDHAEHQGLGPRDRLELFAKVCDAVEYAHGKGVIHRDLKPGNILVEEGAGSSGQPKILDFGVARATWSGFQPDSFYTRTGQLVGTLSYMSPEQVRGRPDELDARSDVYQLGVLLYELLTGRRPYDVEGLPVTEAARVIVETEPPRLGSVDTRWRGDVETIVGKALEKDRERRYASAARLAEDIRRFLRGDPITARPPSAVQRIRLFRRRHQVLVQLALLTTLAALLSLGIPKARDSIFGGPESPSLAVLFFENLGSSESDDYFAAGLTEDVITKLSQIHQLEVTSRTAVERYRGRAVDPQAMRRDLGIGYYMEGSVRKEGDELRVTAQLIDAASGFHVWSRTFDGALDQIFAIQDTITMNVAKALGVRIEPEEIPLFAERWTKNAEAYASYLTGREMLMARRYYSPDWSVEPQVWFEKALQLDPDYAPALAGVAQTLTAAWSIGLQAPGQLERAARLAERAKAIDPTLLDAWLAAGTVPFQRAKHGRFDRPALQDAFEQFKALTEKAPEYGEGFYYLGWVCQDMERTASALENYQKAWQLTDRTSMYRNLVQVYAELGRFHEAEVSIDAALSRHPDDADLLFAKALLLSKRGRFEDAIEVGRSALARHPDHYHLRFYLARDMARAGHPAQADSVIESALERWPATAEVWTDAAQVSTISGDLDTSERRLRKAIELQVYHQDSWRALRSVLDERGDFEEEERVIRKCIEFWPGNWGFRADLARLHERRGRLQQAEEEFRAAARDFPDVHWTLQRLAAFYVRQKRYDQAEDVMRTYAERWPDDPQVTLELSYLWHDMGRHDSSETWARKALERDPGSREAHAQIGWQCLRQGRPEEAIDWFGKAIAIGPPREGAYRGRSQAFQQLGRVDDAVRTMQDFVELQPVSPQGWGTLGGFQEAAGNDYQAVAAYERALELDPENAGMMSNLARVYGRLGRTGKELELYRRAAEVDSTSAAPWAGIAFTAFYRMGDDERAEAAARKALELAQAPNQRVSMLGVLGSICKSRGDKEQAQGYFDKAREEVEGALRINSTDLTLTASAMSVNAEAGNCDRARELAGRLARLANRDPAVLYNAGCAMALCGDKGRAFEYLRMAVDAGFLNDESLRADPDLETLRDDPRFEKLLASVR